MHYMRLRRRGDPAPAPLKPGRKAKPRPDDPVHNALREENAKLTRELERLRAAKPIAGDAATEELVRAKARIVDLVTENIALRRELARQQRPRKPQRPASPPRRARRPPRYSSN